MSAGDDHFVTVLSWDIYEVCGRRVEEGGFSTFRTELTVKEAYLGVASDPTKRDYEFVSARALNKRLAVRK